MKQKAVPTVGVGNGVDKGDDVLAVYRSLLDSLPDAVVVIDGNGIITLWNRVAERLFGYREEEAIGQPVSLLIPSELREQHHQAMQRAITEGWDKAGSRAIETEALRRDGSRVPVELTLSFHPSQEKFTFISVIHDITSRKRREQSLARLLEAAETLASVRPLREMLEVILDTALNLLDREAGSIMLLDETQDVLTIQAARGLGKVMGMQLQVGEGLAGWVVRHGEPLLVENQAADPRFVPRPGALYIEHPVLIVPLIVRGRTVGVLNINAVRPERPFNEADLRLAQALAAHAAVAVDNAYLFETAQRRVRELSALARVGRALSQAITLGEILDLVMEEAMSLSGRKEGSIILLDEQTNTLRIAASRGLSPEIVDDFNARNIRPDQGTFAESILQGQFVEVTDTSTDPRVLDTDRPLPKELINVPLRTPGGVIGTLVLDAIPPDEESRYLLQALADMAAVAIERASLHEGIRQRLEAMTALYSISLDITRHLDQHQLLRSVVEQAVRLVGADAGGFCLYDRERQVLRWVVGYGFVEKFIGRTLEPGEGVAGRVYQSKKPLVVDDYRSWEGRASGFQDETEIVSALGVPLIWQGRVQGVLEVVTASEKKRFTPHDVWLVSLLANQAAVAVENARLFEAEHRRSVELETLRQASLHLTSTLELQSVLEAIIDHALKLVAADNAHIFLYDGERLTFGAALWAGSRQKEPFAEPRPHGLTYTVARSGERIVVPDVNSHPLFQDYRWGGAIVGLPLCIGERVVGVMNVAFKRPHLFNEDELRVLGLLADQAAVAVENARLHESLRESEEMYRTLSEYSLTGVYLIQDGVFRYVNRRLAEFFGYTPVEIVGQKGPLDLIIPSEREETQQLLDDLLAGKIQEINHTLHGLCKDSSTIDIEIFGRVVTYRGRPAILGTLLDITERKRLEEQLRRAQKLEAIGTLAGGIAHDFNNILSGILGYASFIEQQLSPTDPLRPDVETIIRSAQRAADLTRQLLTFARGGRLEVQSVDLNEIVEEVVRLLSRTIDRAIAIETHLTPELRPVDGDPAQLQQMLLNLCLNARDAMPQGGRLTIETANVSLSPIESSLYLDLEAGDYVVLTVTDTGVGMDKATQERIFEPFFTTKEHGRGLGLAMVHSIVRGHGGAIHVYSELGQGTTIKVYLPAGERRPRRLAEPTPEVRGGTETVLVVDDEEVVRHLLKRILQRGGYTVLQAQDGLEALEIYRKQGEEIDLVILDMIMPRLGGKATLKRLRELDPGVKVLFSSGYSEEDQAREVRRMKVQGFLQKPYDVLAVLRQVREALDSE